MSQKNSLDQEITYEPLNAADHMDLLSTGFKFAVMSKLVMSGQPLEPGAFEAAIDAELDAQRVAAPHAARDAVLAMPEKVDE